RVVHTQGRIHDQGYGPGCQVILGVHDPPEFANLPHCIPETISRFIKKGGELREQATKPIVREHKPLVGMAREHARGAQSHSTYAECSEELSSTDPTGLLVVRSTHAVLLGLAAAAVS